MQAYQQKRKKFFVSEEKKFYRIGYRLDIAINKNFPSEAGSANFLGGLRYVILVLTNYK